VRGGRQRERDLIHLGRAFRELRERQRVSVSALAASTGMAPGEIEALEAGRLNPGYELLLGLADGVGVRPLELVTRFEELSRRETEQS
jgi:transcriptional regulator with XRE-family HTH domain